VLERRLMGALDKLDRPHALGKITAVTNPHFAPMLHLRDERRGVERYAGYSPATRRVVQIACHTAGDRDDDAMRRHTASELLDQPADAAMRWAILGASFTTPPGLVYQAATLNLGDMQVRVGRPHRGEFSGPCVVVRQWYPAQLALTRQAPELWMQAMMSGLKQVYRGPREARRLRQPSMPRVATARGQALHVPLRMRWLARTMLWRCPGRRDLWLLHDEGANRLVGVQIAGDPASFDATLTQVIAGLHWAGAGAVP
jgi:hypothetical protein